MATGLLRGLGRALGLQERLRGFVRREIQEVTGPLKQDVLRKMDGGLGKERKIAEGQVRDLRRQLKALKLAHEDLTETTAEFAQRVKLLERIAIENDRDRNALLTLADRLDPTRLSDHLRDRLRDAEVQTDPYPHLFIEEALPEDFYRLLIESIPPLICFPAHDPIKRNFSPFTAMAPTKSKIVWEHFDTVVCREILLPALTAKFAPFLDAHYGSIFGTDFVDRAHDLPQINTKGRLMCRKPGYKLEPHTDPKRVFLTALLYLPRAAGEDEQYGTQILRSERDFVPRYLNTYYPERDGIKCELVKTVPFRTNSLLVFLNANAVHAAHIPDDQAPAELERYAYQFYIGPEPEALKELIDLLPEERQAAWRQRTAARSKQNVPGWHEENITLVERATADPDMKTTASDPV